MKNDARLDALLRSAFRHATESTDENETSEFVFHMRDWEEDLRRLARLFQEPDACSEEECRQAIGGLLLHACGHIVQAARLYGGVIDAFGGD